MSDFLQNSKKNFTKEPQFWDEQGHLNDSGVSLFVEALLLKRSEELPRDFHKHTHHCARCQKEVVEFYEMMRDEDPYLLLPHPYLDRKKERGPGLRTLYTRSLKVAAVFILFFLVSLVFLFFNNNNRGDAVKIQSPFQSADLQIKSQNWKIDAGIPQTLVLESGSVINIPANTFIDQNGKVIEGEVIISLREFRKASEIISSGVPVTYDSTGTRYILESAGIFEIRGSQNNQPIQIARDRSIEVNFSSFYSNHPFNNYYLNEKKAHIPVDMSFVTQPAFAVPGNLQWSFFQSSKAVLSDHLIEKADSLLLNKMTEMDSVSRQLLRIQNESLNAKKNKEEKNQTFAGSSDYFQLSLNLKDNPFLMEFNDVIWKYEGEDPAQSPVKNNHWIFNEKWDQLEAIQAKYKPVTLRGHKGVVSSAVFSPEGQYILTASEDKTAKLWDKEGNFIITLRDHTQKVNSAVFSPDGQHILTASDDQTAKIWSVNGYLIYTLAAHRGAVKNAFYSPDGAYILTVSEDNQASIWTKEGKLISKFPHLHKRKAPCFSSNSLMVLHISNQQEAEMRSMDGRVIKKFPGNYNSMVFSPDNHFILATSANTNAGTAVIWEVNKNFRQKNLSLNDEEAFFSPDGQHLLTLGGNSARLWSLYKPLLNTVLISNLAGKEKKGHQEELKAAVFDATGSMILTASADHSAKLWGGDGRFWYTFRGHGAQINSARFSPDGQQILTASDDGTARLWSKEFRDDVFDLELTKVQKIIKDEEGNRIALKGKEFFTTVRRVSKEEVNRPVEQPRPEENPMNALLEKYEKLFNEIRQLDKQKDQKNSQVLRSFSVKQFGFYQCARPYEILKPNVFNASLQWDKEMNAKKVRVFHITGEYETVICPYLLKEDNHLQLTYDPLNKNKVLFLIPQDRFALIRQSDIFKQSMNEFRLISQEPIHLLTRQLNTREELNKLLDSY